MSVPDIDVIHISFIRSQHSFHMTTPLTFILSGPNFSDTIHHWSPLVGAGAVEQWGVSVREGIHVIHIFLRFMHLS